MDKFVVLVTNLRDINVVDKISRVWYGEIVWLISFLIV